MVMAQELQENKPCPVLRLPSSPCTSFTKQFRTNRYCTTLCSQKRIEQLQTDYQQYLQTFSHAQAVLDEKTNQLKAALEACQEILPIMSIYKYK